VEAVRRIGCPDPEPYFDRPRSGCSFLADDLTPDDEPEKTLRLLQCEQSERVPDHRGYASILAAEPVEEDGEDQCAIERLGLAAPGRKVEEARGHLVAVSVEVFGKLIHPRCERWNMRENEC
jgi:hypothetical protein